MSRYKFSLRIKHPKQPPSEISKQLTLVPNIQWAVGQERATPNGQPLPGRREETYWVYRFQIDAKPRLSDSIRSILESLTPSAHVFQRIRETGGNAELFVGCFIDSNVGEILDWELMRNLGELRLNLVLDLYPEDGK